MKHFAIFLFVCAAIVGSSIVMADHVHGSSSKNAAKTAKPSSGLTLDSSALKAVQTALNNNPDLDTAVSITDLQTGKTYHYGETAAYTAASVGKLITATAFLHEVEAGSASLNNAVDGDTAQDLLQNMIVNSDNDAWASMENDIGLDAQQQYASSIGLASYDANANVITSDDGALLLTKLANGTLLNSSDTQLLLSYMQQANYRDYIVAAIPSDVTVYHKVGILDDHLHDVAVIKKGGRSYVLAIFSKSNGSYDLNRGASLFGAITSDTLKAFFGQ